MKWTDTGVQSVLIFSVSCFFALGYNALRRDSLPLLATPPQFEQASLSQLAGEGEDEEEEIPFIKMIDITMAKELYNTGVTFLDARDEEEYKAGHIVGALNLSTVQVAEKIPLDKPVVTYCSGEGCELSIEMAESLLDLGFSRIYVFYGGWPEWKKAGYPLEIGL